MVEMAAALSLTGDESIPGQGSLEGIQLAIEEANAAGTGPRIKLAIYDDGSNDETAKALAGKIVASDAVLVLGPALSTASLAAGPVYAGGHLASLTTTAASDLITNNKTTFRMVFKTSDQGEFLANYVLRALGQKQAAVVYADNTYGRSLLQGFKDAAERLGLAARYFPLTAAGEIGAVAQRVAAEPGHPPVVLLTLDAEGALLVSALRRLGVTGPLLGDDSFGNESFSGRLADAPEEKVRSGALTNGVFGLSPMILDSANAEIQDFASRFRMRFGHVPVWFSAAGYDAAVAAIATVRAASAKSIDRNAMRAAVLDHLATLDSPANAVPGLLGPLWFDQDHSRQQAIRIGRFNQARFESAPLQIVPVSTPDADEVASGTVFALDSGRFARLQRIVYAGIFVNEISSLDLRRSSYSADFYLWLRYAQDTGQTGPDPTDLTFPSLLTGSFARSEPAEQHDLPDGTAYRLWRVKGEFRNDFDLRQYPFDHQLLSLSFFNARAAADRIVYVIDRRATGLSPDLPNATAAQAAEIGTAHSSDVRFTSPAAFRNLSEWSVVGALVQRDDLVTHSSLGDPGRTLAEAYRELSGFNVSIEIKRRAIATSTKTLLPLGLMTLIMYVSLFYPVAMFMAKVSVAITGALSGAVLLSAVNSQLGAIGYTIAVEYVFYVFFGLCVLCIVAVLSGERFLAAGQEVTARRMGVFIQAAFVAIVILTAAGAVYLADTASLAIALLPGR
jgi:branched-chain amino acid transport system substrate-binding protein